MLPELTNVLYKYHLISKCRIEYTDNFLMSFYCNRIGKIPSFRKYIYVNKKMYNKKYIELTNIKEVSHTHKGRGKSVTLDMSAHHKKGDTYYIAETLHRKSAKNNKQYLKLSQNQIADILSKYYNMHVKKSILCREYNISMPTLNKYLKNYTYLLKQ